VDGRGTRRLAKTFDRKADAQLFEAELKRRRALGDLTLIAARRQTVDELALDWYELHARPNLAHNTLVKYVRILRERAA